MELTEWPMRDQGRRGGGGDCGSGAASEGEGASASSCFLVRVVVCRVLCVRCCLCCVVCVVRVTTSGQMSGESLRLDSAMLWPLPPDTSAAALRKEQRETERGEQEGGTRERE